jgi:hypothetical protein
MKNLFRLIVFSFILMMPLSSYSQEAPKQKAPASMRLQRKAAKAKWKQQRKDDHDHKKMVKEHHKKIQTKLTRKNMRKVKRKSERANSNKK